MNVILLFVFSAVIAAGIAGMHFSARPRKNREWLQNVGGILSASAISIGFIALVYCIMSSSCDWLNATWKHILSATGLLSMICGPIGVWTWSWNKYQRIKAKKKRDARRNPGMQKLPLVFTVSLSDVSIRNDAIKYIESQPTLLAYFKKSDTETDEDVKKNLDVCTYDYCSYERLDISRSSLEISASLAYQLHEFEQHINEAFTLSRNIKGAANVKGSDIWLFYLGPAVLGTKIGERFANCNTLHLFHFHYSNKTYCYAGCISDFQRDNQ